MANQARSFDVQLSSLARQSCSGPEVLEATGSYLIVLRGPHGAGMEFVASLCPSTQGSSPQCLDIFLLPLQLWVLAKISKDAHFCGMEENSGFISTLIRYWKDGQKNLREQERLGRKEKWLQDP